VAPHVDGRQILYAGEADHAGKVALLGGARALLFPIQWEEPFGLVMIEAMACGTPVAALERGAVREVIENDLTGVMFPSLDAPVDGLPRVLALDRARVRSRVERFGVDRMVDEYVTAYRHLVAAGANTSGKGLSGSSDVGAAAEPIRDGKFAAGPPCAFHSPGPSATRKVCLRSTYQNRLSSATTRAVE
jgi:hypothetical protein